ncbi:MAG TPA: universal stress protein [Chloroflexota bacterium]|nr:universal stress protein [Chloroflexota bacterium]
MESPSNPSVYGKILVPYDGSDGAEQALRRALFLVSALGGDITVFIVDEHTPRYAKGVGEVSEDPDLRSAYFADLQAKAKGVASEAGAEVQTATAVGHAAQSILQMAVKRRYDLIVIGHTGHSGVWGTLLGSTTARVVDQAPCDVIVVR